MSIVYGKKALQLIFVFSLYFYFASLLRIRATFFGGGSWFSFLVCILPRKSKQSWAQKTQILRKHVITYNLNKRVSSRKSKKLDLHPKSRGSEVGLDANIFAQHWLTTWTINHCSTHNWISLQPPCRILWWHWFIGMESRPQSAFVAFSKSNERVKANICCIYRLLLQ